MRQAEHSRLFRALAICGAGCFVTASLAVGFAAGDAFSAPEAPSYTNPVGDAAAANFADPTMIRGRDGYWYAYATGGARFAGDLNRKMKIARSRDLVNWEYVGDVFTSETEPRYDGYGDDAVRMYWAPDIEYFGDRYLLYYSYVVNVGTDRHWRAIGVATAQTPAGPWTDSGAFVTGPETWEPRPGVEAWRNVIDPEVAATPDGTRYLYYGSVNGGVRVVRLSEDGLTAVGERTQVTLEQKYEASHIVHRDGYYYLFLSVIGGCCAGPVSAYPVHVGRAASPLGPFVDREGIPVLGRHAGGTPVQAPNGNRWVSVGHNTIATDLSGQQWLVSHGIDRYVPYLQGTANARHLVISRLDWIDGWPTANAGRGLLDGPRPAPRTTARIADDFEVGATPGPIWESATGWELGQEPAGGYLQNTVAEGERVLHATTVLAGNVRIRGAARLDNGTSGSAGFAIADHDSGGIRAVIDRASEEFVIEVRLDGNVVDRSRHALPPSFRYDDWHEIDVRLRERSLSATVTDAGLDDPVAVAAVNLPSGFPAGRMGAASNNSAALFDDITVATLFTPVTKKLPDPDVGALVPELGDEFDVDIGTGWQWIRTPVAQVSDGELVFPVQEAELIDQRPIGDDTASVLLREPPAGDWTVETRVTVPLGESFPYGWPQAGLVAYADDDHFAVLGYAAAARTRHVTFGKEMPWENRVLYADARLGPTTDDTVWLRLKHQVDPKTGEHQYRAATSVDADNWVWHGVRVLPAGSTPLIGLAAFGIQQDQSLSARFDYLRFYQP